MLCTYSYPRLASWPSRNRDYSAFLATKIWMLDDARETPAHTKYDGANYYPTSKWVMFGHHFAAITGAGPLVGPMLAAQFGYAPGFIWLVAGVCLAGAVHDSMILWASVRRGGKSLRRNRKQEIGPVIGFVAAIAILFIVVIALAGLGIAVVNALADSAWGTFTVAMTIPLGCSWASRCTCVGAGKITEATVIGVSACSSRVMLGEPIGALGIRFAPVPPQSHGSCRRARRLRLRGVGAAGVAAALPARLSQLVHEDRHHLPARASA